MTLEAIQIKLNCPLCGNYFWRVTRTVYNMVTKAWEEKETTAFCQECEKGKYLDVLKHADKIVPIPPKEERKT